MVKELYHYTLLSTGGQLCRSYNAEPPPPLTHEGASNQQPVAKGTGLMSPWVPKRPTIHVDQRRLK